MRDNADDCLPAFIHRDVLHADGLLASAPVSLERLHLCREGSSEFIEGPLRAVLLRDVFHMCEAARESHGGVVEGGHLRGEHDLDLVLRCDALHNGEHEIEPVLVRRPGVPALRSCLRSPSRKSFAAGSEGVTDVEELNKVLDRAVGLRTFLTADNRIIDVAEFVAEHFKESVLPLGYKAFLVAEPTRGSFKDLSSHPLSLDQACRSHSCPAG